MTSPIVHPAEKCSNETRENMAQYKPASLRTYTPSQAVLGHQRRHLSLDTGRQTPLRLLFGRARRQPRTQSYLLDTTLLPKHGLAGRSPSRQCQLQWTGFIDPGGLLFRGGDERLQRRDSDRNRRESSARRDVAKLQGRQPASTGDVGCIRLRSDSKGTLDCPGTGRISIHDPGHSIWISRQEGSGRFRERLRNRSPSRSARAFHRLPDEGMSRRFQSR